MQHRHAWLLVVGALLLACTKRDLRGTSKPSPDGKTYVVLDELGGECPVTLDGRPWTTKLGVSVAVTPGIHYFACKGASSGIGFRVEKGTTFHFDYWGP